MGSKILVSDNLTVLTNLKHKCRKAEARVVPIETVKLEAASPIPIQKQLAFRLKVTNKNSDTIIYNSNAISQKQVAEAIILAGVGAIRAMSAQDLGWM
ncbi:MAG: hypothetical protein ACYCX4_03835 [Bacillota bacterium]